MDTSTIFAISASGMRAQRLRLDVIAANLANAQSTRSPEGGPYRRRDVVLEAVSRGESFEDLLAPGAGGASAVEVSRVVTDTHPPRMVYDPGHPDADTSGFVAMPNINVVSEMVDMMAASRAYEANVAALNATKRVLEAALEIGRV
jgi:flagellar basal-body rod protein FlgC